MTTSFRRFSVSRFGLALSGTCKGWPDWLWTAHRRQLLFADFLPLGLVWLSEKLAEAGQVGFGWGVVLLAPDGGEEEGPGVAELEQLLPLLLPPPLPPLLLLLPAPLVPRQEVRLGDAAQAAHACEWGGGSVVIKGGGGSFALLTPTTMV
jgi:hypothetical protein